MTRADGSPNDECYTPAEELRRARLVLGEIDVDPASSRLAQRVVRAHRYYTKRDDGLKQRWTGRVWMNPPYSYPDPWVTRLLQLYHEGHVTEAIALLNGRPGSKWFQALRRHAWSCERRKRIRFEGPGAGPGGSGFMDNVFFYLGPKPERFSSVFSEIGEIIRPSVTVSVTLAVTRCEVCGRSLDGLRADAVTCSPACKQRAYRKRLLVNGA